MIHFTCDGCDRLIDTEQEQRYILRLEVYEAPESPTSDGFSGEGNYADSASTNSERDHLEELEDLLERVDDFVDTDGEASASESHRLVRFDLCNECRNRVLANPLGRMALSKIDFSDN